MTYTQIKREIGKRLGDNDLKKYRGVVGNSFLQAIGEVLLSGDCSPTEYPELYLQTNIALYGSGKTNIPLIETVLEKAIKLIDVENSHTSGKYIKQIEENEFKRMDVEEAFQPVAHELFWYYDNKKLYVISDYSLSQSINIVVLYLQNPDSSNWNFNKDLIEDLKYGRNFIYKCIDKAVANIAAMPMLRPVTQGK